MVTGGQSFPGRLRVLIPLLLGGTTTIGINELPNTSIIVAHGHSPLGALVATCRQWMVVPPRMKPFYKTLHHNGHLCHILVTSLCCACTMAANSYTVYSTLSLTWKCAGSAALAYGRHDTWSSTFYSSSAPYVCFISRSTHLAYSATTVPRSDLSTFTEAAAPII